MGKKALMPMLLFSGILSITAWTGLGLVLIYLPPTIGPRWLFFFFLFTAVSSIMLPVFLLINQRIEQGAKFGIFPAVRESLEFGFYINLIVWLKFGRVLDTITAILILVVIIAIEFFIRLFERSRFKPTEQESEIDEE